MRQAHCENCHRAAWVNVAHCFIEGHCITRELCAACFEIVPHAEPARNRERGARGSGPNHNDPGFDNIIRTIEDCEHE